MATEKREVKAVLDLSLGPEGEKALRQLSEAIGKADVAFQQLKKTAASSGPQVIGPMTGAAGQAMANARGVAGGGGFFGGVPGGLFAAAGGAAAALQAASTYANLSRSPYLTESQRSRAVVNEIPVVGHLARLGEGFAGRPQAMQAIDIAHEKAMARMNRDVQVLGLGVSRVLPQAGREEAYRQAAGAAPVNLPGINRDTTRGERAFREESRLLPVRREIAKATREEATATAERNKAQEIFVRLKEEEAERQTEVAKLRERVDDKGQGSIVQADRVKNLKRAESELQGVVQERLKAQEALAAAETKAGGARGRTLETLAAHAETRSELAYTRADTYAASGARLGGMNPYERQFGVQALKALQQYGPDAIGPQMLAAAQQIAPETARKAMELHGRGTAEYEELKGLAPTEYGDVKGARQTAVEAAKEAEGLRRQAETETTKAAADAGRDMAVKVKEVLDILLDSFKREIDNNQRVRDAQ